MHQQIHLLEPKLTAAFDYLATVGPKAVKVEDESRPYQLSEGVARRQVGKNACSASVISAEGTDVF